MEPKNSVSTTLTQRRARPEYPPTVQAADILRRRGLPGAMEGFSQFRVAIDTLEAIESFLENS
jgi:hypothetical protein